MKFIYYFGEEDWEFEPDLKEVRQFLIENLIKDLKKTKDEVEQMLEDEEFFDECLEDYQDELIDYFKEDAENSYKDNQESFDGFDDYEDFCRWRNPNLY